MGDQVRGHKKGPRKHILIQKLIWRVNNLASCPLLNLGVGNTSENAAFFKWNVFFPLKIIEKSWIDTINVIIMLEIQVYYWFKIVQNRKYLLGL